MEMDLRPTITADNYGLARQYITDFTTIVGDRYVITASDVDECDGTDRESILGDADVLVKPGNTAEVASLLRLCHQHKIPLSPSSGATGVVRGSIPVENGLVLSLERLNRIHQVDSINKWVWVEAGVITETLFTTVKSHGLYYPVLPGSGGSSMIGGNIATSAGSPKSAKYGTIKQYVLNMEVVLPTGEIMFTGANVYKNATGFNLNELLVGSEGTLGIITKVLLKLLPLPTHELTVLAAFASDKKACEAVTAISGTSLDPACVELISENAIRLTRPFVSKNAPFIGNESVKAQVIIELDAHSEEVLCRDLERVYATISPFTFQEPLVATNVREKERLWELRTSIGEAMTSNGLTYRDVDASVPVTHLFQFMVAVNTIMEKHALEVCSFGHAKDGNLHTMLVYKQERRPEEVIDKALQEIYRSAVAFGGTISGEHGIGELQKDYLPLALSETQIRVMEGIKKVFDPNHILNPGKIFNK